MDLSMAFWAHLTASSFAEPTFITPLSISSTSPDVMLPASFSGIPPFIFLTFLVLL